MNSISPKINAVASPRRVLLVEDSSVTQDIVELMLTQAGHTVSIASDGAMALRLLAKDEFDVVLTDFHLPDITGLDVVTQYLETHPQGPRPAFVAITGDVRGLLADRANCEVFDRIVPKPLDIDLLCELVEAPVVPVVPTVRVKAVPGTAGNAIEALPLAYFRWPASRNQDVTPRLMGVDAILVESCEALDVLWRQPGVNTLPVIDMTGRLGTSADVDGTALRLGDTDRILALVELFHDRRAELHTDFLRSNEPTDRLLARLHVANTPLTPRLDGTASSLFAWNLVASSDEIGLAVSKLVAEGFLETAFHERVHHCPACQSARLIVREECSACGSAHLNEESYLHHFRCSYQGPETDFRHGDELTCPKCRRTLAHFGRDYDRPGLMVRCQACAAITSEPSVAFRCVDCATRTPADAAPTRDILSAKITEQGFSYLETGLAFLGATRQSLRFADLPLELIISLNKAASRFNEDKTPFVLGYIAHDNLLELRRKHGARQTEDARDLWIETFRQAIGPTTTVTKGASQDFFLTLDMQKLMLGPNLEVARGRADKSVRLDLGARFQLFGPEDITG